MGSIRERLLDMGEEVRCIPVPVDTSPEQCSSGGGCSDEACDAYHDDDDDDEESPGDSFLFAAVDNNVTAIRQLIQEMGVSPSHSNPAKQSALHLAALWGNGTYMCFTFAVDTQQLETTPPRPPLRL